MIIKFERRYTLAELQLNMLNPAEDTLKDEVLRCYKKIDEMEPHFMQISEHNGRQFGIRPADWQLSHDKVKTVVRERNRDGAFLVEAVGIIKRLCEFSGNAHLLTDAKRFLSKIPDSLNEV